ncbi:SRPBCC domain-containing protein [Catenuloplanes japonicus]|uniref:SRPBCC domain-containing protein n=1 Tax=Catenuloplanes japonicus TaxID=33876 RepID=UPI000527ACCC|nr:SRPBCC domain-containing protein [Catenuloplanes japonicus]
MEYGRIARQVHIDAPPEIVYDVLSRPEHLREWWPDDAHLPGGDGWISFGADKRERFTVVDADPPRTFSFRWTHPDGEAAAPGNSFLVVFTLEPAGGGTLLRMTESGFRERGWDEATAAAAHADHVRGWDLFLPRLPVYAAKLT